MKNIKKEDWNVKKMKIHNLKIDKELIDLKIRGVKNWEIRYNDRNYKVGDILFLREYNQTMRRYETVCVYERITAILPKKACYGLQEGYVILVTQPLFVGNYHHIEEFIKLGSSGALLVSWLAKSLQTEDYCVWENLHTYNWDVINAFFTAELPQGKCINMMYKRM